MLKFIRRSRRLISMSILLFSAVTFFYSNQFAALRLIVAYWDPFSITHYRLSMLSTDTFINEIENSLEEGDLSEAQSLVSLAADYGHDLPDDVVARTKENFLGLGYRYTTSFADGFVFGEVKNLPTLLGSVVSDFSAYGDVRDLIAESSKYLSGEDYSTITIAISALGVVTSTPATAPLDTGLSILKAAHKTKRISRPLLDMLARSGKDAVNLSALKAVAPNLVKSVKVPSMGQMIGAVKSFDFSQIAKGNFSSTSKLTTEAKIIDIKAAQKAVSGVVNPSAVGGMMDFAKNAGSIAATGGFFTAFRALRYADNAADVAKISKISRKFGDKTLGVLKVLGKASFKLGKLAYKLIMLALSIAAWSLWFAWLTYSLAKSCVSVMNRTRTTVAP